MQRVDEYRFYELGQKIKAIQGISGNSLYEDWWYPLWEARTSLERLKDDAVAFRISRAVVDRVVAAITAIVPAQAPQAIEKMIQNPDGSKPTIGWPSHELEESIKHFEPVLAAECSALDTYVISQKRGYSTPDLIERAEVMLSIENTASLPPGVLTDIRAAGRCLAFDIPTAAGFHILRATEAVMALYYLHVTGKVLPKQNRNWGKFLVKLKGYEKADAKIIGALDHIKENYRNPITHPEDTLTEGQAILLFGLSLSVLEIMAEVMRTTTPALTEVEQLKAEAAIAEEKASQQADDF